MDPYGCLLPEDGRVGIQAGLAEGFVKGQSSVQPSPKHMDMGVCTR